MSLKNKTVTISGASRGIGCSVALELASEGANISFNYLNSSKEADNLEKQIKSLGAEAKAFRVDIRDYSAVKSWVEETKNYFGGIDVIVNNAGITKDRPLAFMDPAEWNEVINTNLNGTFNLTRAAILTLIKQKSGAIINIASVSGMTGIPGQTNYSASKAGIIGFTKALAKEVAPYNIRVNAVAPGFVETDMLSGLKEGYRNKITGQIPLNRFGSAQEVAKAVKYLASDGSDYITGQTIVLDGGMSLAQ